MLRLKRTMVVAACLTLAALACTLTSGNVAEVDGAVALINSPADGSEVPVGEAVTVELTIVDAEGVVEGQQLSLNGVMVASRDTATPPGETHYDVSLSFTPTEEGTATLEVQLLGEDGPVGDPARIMLMVVAAGEAQEAEDGGEAPEATETNPPPVEDEERGCTNDMRYVADVTVPDGTEMEPGETFTKTWTIRNNGTCDWGGYSLVYHSDDQMGGPASVTVPATSAGQIRDVSVDLTAPDDPGTHFSRWTMRSPDGVLFGNVIYAEIEVVEPEEEEAPPEGEEEAPGEEWGPPIENSYPVDDNNSGLVVENGYVSFLPIAGDTLDDERKHAFLSWDLSSIPSEAEILEANIYWDTECVQFTNPTPCPALFSGLGSLTVRAYHYAVLDGGDFSAAGLNGGVQIIAYGVKPSGFVTVTDEVTQAHALGHSFQIYAYFSNDSDNNGKDNGVLFSEASGDNMLVVSYRLPVSP